MNLLELFDKNPPPGERVAPTDQNINYDKLIDYIKKYCGQSLSIMKETNCKLYRGFRTRAKGQLYTDNTKHIFHPDVFLGNPRTDREPLAHGGEKFQKIVDQVYDYLNIKSKRSNSIFCTSNLHETRNYGDEYVIFPIGNFNYSWSQMYPDLYDARHTINSRFEDRILTLNELKTVQNILLLTDENIQKALEENFEILISSPYVAISIKDYIEISKRLGV